MEEARDSAPPVEEEAPAPAPAPETPRTPPPVPHLTLVFVGLDGAGKTAVIRALGKDGEGERKSVSDEGALCAPPTTVAVTIHAGLRACGVSLDVVDVPGRGVVAGNARHVAWRRHLDALVTPEDDGSVPKEIAKRTRIAKPIGSVDCVVFVVDAADEFRMAVARDELWRLCGLVPPGDESGPGRFRTLERSAAPARLADSTAVLVLANKSDVAGALAAGEVGDALDLDQLRAEMGAAGMRVLGCEACSAVDGSGIERALEGALRRGR